MSTSNYSPEILKTLHEGGWKENRAVSTDSVERFIKSDGFAWFPQVEEFLKEFLGLFFLHTRSNGSTTDFKFDAVLSTVSSDTYWILKHYRSIIAKQAQFCPVGVLSGSHMQLFMDDDECFYGDYDDILVFFGKGKEEFLHNLCAGKGVRIDS